MMSNPRARLLAPMAGLTLALTVLSATPAHAGGTPGNLCTEGWRAGETTFYAHNGHQDTVQFQGHNDRIATHYHYWNNRTHGNNLVLECH